MKKLYHICLFYLSILPFTAIAGIFIEDGFVSSLVPPSPRILNPLDKRRLFTIYIPDGYDTPGEQFPVIYYCPGLGGNDHSFNPGNKEILDNLIENKLMVPTLVVHVDPSLVIGPTVEGTYTYQGSWYVDSELNGLFETYITTELIPYVDLQYKTKPQGAFRAIMGQSMGGFGALFLGTRHPDLFCGFGSASGTAFWAVTTNLANPYPEMTFNSLVIPEIPTSGPNAGKILPTNGTNTFSIFSYAAAFSPNLSKPPFFVDLPFQVNSDNTPVLVPGSFIVGNVGNPCSGQLTVPSSLTLDPAVITQWQSFDPYFLMDDHIPTLAQQTIYVDGGNTEAIDNVGARLISDKYSTYAIDHEYILYNGGHVQCLDAPACSRHRTMFQLFSAKFAEAGNFPNDIRTKIIGTGSIIVQNGTWNIPAGTMVGIETDPLLSVNTTNIAITIADEGSIQIGDYSTTGGALQIGNNFGKAILNGNPALLSDTVSASLTIDGENARFQLGKQGFFGIGMGINGQAPSVPNFWSISRLTNLQNMSYTLNKGTLVTNQIPNGQNEGAALWALGPSEQYSFSIDPSLAIVRGGCSHMVGTDVWQLHPTLLNTTGLLPSSGILVNLDTNPSAIDCFYIKPMGSTAFYNEQLTRNASATSAEYDDRGLPNNFSISTTSPTAFFNFLSTTSYIDQLSKEAALTRASDGSLGVAYVDNSTIAVVPTDQAPVGTNGTIVFSTIAEDSGTVGIWVESVNGKRELILVYDIDPA